MREAERKAKRLHRARLLFFCDPRFVKVETLIAAGCQCGLRGLTGEKVANEHS